MVGHFIEMCRRKSLKLNTDKSEVIVLGGEEGLECKIRVDMTRLELMSEFKIFKVSFE